jgi:glycosyltransferase involved in cell wall biosynthesis
MRVHQVYYAVIPGDAVGNHILEIDARLRAWGFETYIYAQYIAPEMADRVRPDRDYLPYLHAEDDLLIYHYGLYTSSAYYLQAARSRRIFIYHNITPASYFHGWSRRLELLCDAGRSILPRLTACDLALGVSDYNRRELVDAGFPEGRTDVLPLFLQQAHFETLPVDQDLLGQLQAERMVNFLVVGRVAPHKAIEDAIRIFYVYHQAINSQSRLHVVGPNDLASYAAALDALVADLGLGDAVRFTNRVPNSALKAYYQAADLYLCASQHEGFCAPLVESMYFGLPILARKAAAVPETMGDAGVFFTRLGYAEAAEMAHLLLSDRALRAQVIAKQRERLQAMAPAQVEARFRGMLIRLGIPVPMDGKADLVHVEAGSKQ